ncbi:MAG: zinc ABC transporter substrate-binding protein [Verrucomicrobia bacterium]|nr:MAG: zinc ABC transporter substrate-binding protein [Verrucomicrobiota bacterium]
MKILLAIVCAVLACQLSAEPLKVVVLHPLLGDIARNVGGEQVMVIDLLGPNGDPHHFQPTSEDLKKTGNAQLYLASGKGLESYLPTLREIIGGQATIIEVGATLPSLEGGCDHEEDHDEPAGHDHEHGLDPHWWHSIDAFRRATQVVADAFVQAAPEHADEFRASAERYRESLDKLETWSKREIAKIPREARHLATAHAAFNYFCHEFSFTPHSVQGINREQIPDAETMALILKKLKDEQVAVIFPEEESNPKILQSLTADTGIRLGKPLIADGIGMTSYEEMMRHNVNAIVEALAPR